jgi:hypothetical protein
MSQEPTESFLTESQLEGRANKASAEVVEKLSLDDALKSYMKIRNDDAIAEHMTEDSWPGMNLAIYCQDCRNVAPEGKGWTLRGNPRVICGACGSKKVAQGKEEALKKHYHVPKDAEPLVAKDPAPFVPDKNRFAGKSSSPRMKKRRRR